MIYGNKEGIRDSLLAKLETLYDIEIPAEFPAVGEILNCNITPYLTECRAAGDQINTSYGVNVSVLYTAEAFEDAEESSLPKYVRFDKKIPLQVALSAPGVTPEYECYAEMRTGEIEAKADINNLGEMRVIELDFDMPVKVSCFKNVCDRIVCDAFSTDCDIQLNRRRIECKKLIKNTVSNFSDRILIPSDDGKINELLDLGIITVPGEITVKKNKLQMDGNCYFSAIINDENSEIRALNGEKAIRFECECPTPLGESEHLCNTEVSDVRCRIDGATLCIDFEITVSMMVFDKAYEEFVSAINVEKKSEDCPKHTGLRMYYPNSDETLWNIAKKYRVGIDTLIHENSLAEASDPRSNIPTEKHVLIIP